MSVKTAARGRPGCLGRTCGSFPVHSLRTGAMGAASSRPSLRPPISRVMSLQSSGALAPRERAVICNRCLNREEISEPARAGSDHVLFEASASATAVLMSATENGFVITSWAIADRFEARSR